MGIIYTACSIETAKDEKIVGRETNKDFILAPHEGQRKVKSCSQH